MLFHFLGIKTKVLRQRRDEDLFAKEFQATPEDKDGLSERREEESSRIAGDEVKPVASPSCSKSRITYFPLYLPTPTAEQQPETKAAFAIATTKHGHISQSSSLGLGTRQTERVNGNVGAKSTKTVVR